MDAPETPGGGTPPPPVDDLVGTTLSDRYLVEKRLGQGGMGTVYLAQHTTIGKHLALKVLSQDFCHKQDLVDRFLQEARAASMISQQNVVEITDFGSTPSGSVYFAMEYLQGEDLSDTLKREGPLPWPRVKEIMLQVCRALAAAHAVGIIHRDMKPENCFRISRGNNDDFIKVLDFGIAKVMNDEADGGKGLTRTGMIFGTPEYMSPEQSRGEPPDHRVDVYAAGIILFELLTGHAPFQAETFMGILTKHMFEPPPAPSASNPDVTPEVEAIVLKALQKDREHRFADMDAFAAALESVGTGAVAVQVVHEDVSRPLEGVRMAFGEGAATKPPDDGPETLPPATREMPLPGRRSPMPMILGGVLGVALVGGGVTAFLLGNDAEPPAPVAAVAAQPEPKPVAEPEPPPPPVKKVIPVGTPEVTLTIVTPGVDARILDAADEGSYGVTNAGGVRLEKAEEPIRLILRAAGYEDKLIEIVPNANARIEPKLVPAAVKKGRRQSSRTKPKPEPTAKSGREPAAKPAAKAKPKPKAKPKAKPDHDSFAPKNPFG